MGFCLKKIKSFILAYGYSIPLRLTLWPKTFKIFTFNSKYIRNYITI